MAVYQSGASQQPLPVDRTGAQEVDLVYGANAVAPHGDTVRATYTVPSGLNADIQSLLLYTFVDTVDLTSLTADFRALITRVGSAGYNWRRIRHTNNTVNSSSEYTSEPRVTLRAGDKLELKTQLVAGGGQARIDIAVNAQVLEYP